MVPFVACLVALSGVSPTLSAAQAVDVRVRSVAWAPRGDRLLYARDEAGGTGLGLFASGDPEGRVVLHLGPGDTWRNQWFEGTNSALVTVERRGVAEGIETRSVLLYLVDARAKTAKEVFSRTVPATRTLSTEAELSPLLTHAVVTVSENDLSHRFVLPLNGGRLVASPDIDRAVAKGLAGPAWTRTGTAIYGERSAEDAGTFEATDGKGNVLSLKRLGMSVESGRGEILLTADSLSTFDNGGGAITLSIRMPQPKAPPLGTVALEVVPINGILRQVRSPGPFAATPRREPDAATQTRSMRLDVEGLRTETVGLCLVGGKGEAAWRLVVAPKAEWGLLAPQGVAVAYSTDGALFVRSVRPR